MKHLLFLFSLSLAISAGANVSSAVHSTQFSERKCGKVLTHSGDILIQRDWDELSRNCFISLHPMDVTDLKYRDYYFNNEGLFLVFNSYGDGPSSTSTGARSFFLFPQVYDYPDYSIESNGDVIIKTVSGHQFLFDSAQLKLKSINYGTVTEKKLAHNNNGGTEITLTKGFWFDAGFKLGGMTTDNPKNSTKVFGSKSGRCTLINTELFNYKLGDYNNPLLYSGESLNLFLQKRCNIQF